MSRPDSVDYQIEPAKYRHWKLAFDGPVATLIAAFDEDGGLRPGYKLKLNSYDLGVDIELNDAVNRIRFEHPEVRTVVMTSGQRPGVLIRRQHLHAGRLQPFLEGEFLQVHQRDPQRSRRLVPPQRAQIPRGGQRLLRRRRLRAGARLRRDPADRRPLERRQPAGSAVARRAARHRRPHPPHRQTPRAARSRRRLLHHQRRRARPESGRLAAGRRDRQARAVCRGDPSTRARAGGKERSSRRGERRRADAARSKSSRRTRCATLMSRSRSTARPAPQPLPSRGRRANSLRTSPRSRPPGQTGIRWRWRASSRTRFRRCAPTSSTSACG